jgi:ketosteroid isomerase-like protein
VDVIRSGDKMVATVRRVADDGGSGNPTANLTTFRDGKAIEMIHYPDPGAALAALDR